MHEPDVRWIVEPSIALEGGRCLDVVTDGTGGAVASFVTNEASPLAGGVVLAVAADGKDVHHVALEQRQLAGMQRAGTGAFAWVDTTAYAGQSSTDLGDLTGVPLPADVWAVDDLAILDDAAAYAIVTGTLLPECRVRISGRPALDSEALWCGQGDDRWRVEPDGTGVVGGLVGQSALVRVDGDGQIVAFLSDRYLRTMFDLAVAANGVVWTVGAIGDPDDVGPTFGSFVARHDADLGEEPVWEGLEEGDTSPVWTAIVLHDGAPILVGRDADDMPRIAGLTETGDLAWTLALDLPPAVFLRHADVDDAGVLVTCGDRAGDTPVLVAVALD